MLVLTRRQGQSIRIYPNKELDLDRPIRELFEDGSIEVRVTQIGGNQVKFGIDAPAKLTILREELCEDPF